MTDTAELIPREFGGPKFAVIFIGLIVLMIGGMAIGERLPSRRAGMVVWTISLCGGFLGLIAVTFLGYWKFI